VGFCGLVDLVILTRPYAELIAGYQADETMGKPTCVQCVHFDDDPAHIEAEFPYLTVFGSAYSSARGRAGICDKYSRFMDPMPAYYCSGFAERRESNGETSRK